MVDPQIVDRMYPIKDLHQNPIGFGSDWPVSSLDPLRGIEVFFKNLCLKIKNK